MIIADNTGARIAQCIGIFGKPDDTAQVGRMIKVTIKSMRSGLASNQPGALPTGNNSETTRVKPGQVHNAVLIRQRKELQRADGRVIRFDENAAVLVTADGKPLGSRVHGPVPMELRKENWLKVLSLSSKVI